jgi:hypothetical protein
MAITFGIVSAAWSDGTGRYIGTDQHLYDPNVNGPGGAWHEMESFQMRRTYWGLPAAVFRGEDTPRQCDRGSVQDRIRHDRSEAKAR